MTNTSYLMLALLHIVCCLQYLVQSVGGVCSIHSRPICEVSCLKGVHLDCRCDLEISECFILGIVVCHTALHEAIYVQSHLEDSSRGLRI